MIVKRLEASVLGRRVHVGQQPMRIAEPGDFVSRHEAQPQIRQETRLRSENTTGVPRTILPVTMFQPRSTHKCFTISCSSAGSNR